MPFILLMLILSVLFATMGHAETVSSSAIETAVAVNTYSTPLLIKLAREGNIKELSKQAQQETTGEFLQVRDKYNNNLFHVAKNADTVQVIAALVRKFYGAKAPAQIETMVNQNNALNETPLLAQINAGHVDTFRPIYTYSLLRKKNETARNQLARLRGSGKEIEGRNKAIYCKEIRQLASANGLTLLQAAQGQVPYHPEMIPLVQALPKMIPCLAQD